MLENRRRNKNIHKRIGSNVSDRCPKVSVIIPAYNAAKFIADTLDSVIKQRFREHEIILVNDGSPDTKELELAIGPQLENIVYIKQKNAGAAIARNTGIEHARADIIAFLDADDIWMPNFLSSQFVFLERHEYDMVYCDALLFGMQSAYRRTFMDTAPSVGEANFESLIDLRCNVITSGTMVRKKAAIDVGCFEVDQVRAHDFFLWLSMAKNGAKIGYQRKPLLKYRVHLDSLSGDAVSRAEREYEAFQHVQKTFTLTDKERDIVERRIEGLGADLAVERGKAFLLNGAYGEAEAAFRDANHTRRSLKLSVVSWLTRYAPRTLVKYYISSRNDDIAFYSPQN